jgi:hypothetical protein
MSYKHNIDYWNIFINFLKILFVMHVTQIVITFNKHA